MRAFERVRASVRPCARARVCVCVCVCVRERERERQRQRDQGREERGNVRQREIEGPLTDSTSASDILTDWQMRKHLCWPSFSA